MSEQAAEGRRGVRRRGAVWRRASRQREAYCVCRKAKRPACLELGERGEGKKGRGAEEQSGPGPRGLVDLTRTPGFISHGMGSH